MSKYGYAVKFNGKYYKAGDEVPDGIQSPPKQRLTEKAGAGKTS